MKPKTHPCARTVAEAVTHVIDGCPDLMIVCKNQAMVRWVLAACSRTLENVDGKITIKMGSVIVYDGSVIRASSIVDCRKNLQGYQGSVFVCPDAEELMSADLLDIVRAGHCSQLYEYENRKNILG